MQTQHSRIIRRIVAVALLVALPVGCARDVRLTGKKLRDADVRAVSHYGQNLDKSGTPKQVAYVMLRAIREDCLAETAEAREAALDIQFDVAAGDTLSAGNRTSRTREELLTQLISHWAPSLCHYAHDLEPDWERAGARLRVRGPEPVKGDSDGRQLARVFMDVSDSSGDANARVIVAVSLVTERGFWRVTRVGFVPNRRSLTPRTAGAGMTVTLQGG